MATPATTTINSATAPPLYREIESKVGGSLSKLHYELWWETATDPRVYQTAKAFLLSYVVVDFLYVSPSMPLGDRFTLFVKVASGAVVSWVVLVSVWVFVFMVFFASSFIAFAEPALSFFKAKQSKR
ncbi:Aste57867_10433 [Aphanomyces stellatus]|uniref:Aste57867_10433 protein n=1 Tax=Aphanomyces stellatus TaxID=120398 RepID=A0A485KRF1_9STRA|nr:hypothetical protein As57867_010393 [Aphanomyces stellatus]VFT87307.1 Aste57867_10433 [Aphanomyces stellatus]